MTNPKTRKTGKRASHHVHGQQPHSDVGRRVQVSVVQEEEDEEDMEDLCGAVPSWAAEENYSSSPPSSTSDIAVDNEGEEDDIDSCSAFSLQECINEFHARRIRRISTQSREATAPTECTAGGGASFDPADADLINQNRSNKEQERKCKPCQNGFCYCFTSDSGDASCCGADTTTARAAHVRQPARRSRKSESSQLNHIAPQRQATNSKEKRRQSAPAKLKATQKTLVQQQSAKPVPPPRTNERSQLTAISRLETSCNDAPLIHIIQELHNNCVISEVRVNKQKMQQHQRSQSLNARTCQTTLSPPKKSSRPEHEINQHKRSQEEKSYPQFAHHCRKEASPHKSHTKPSAPPLDRISEFDSLTDGGYVYSTPLDTSSKSHESGRHKNAGRLLQKRLSHAPHIQYKPRNFDQPPPKPPRLSGSISFEEKCSVSTLASTSPSVREAERVLDEFLRQKGVKLPVSRETQTMRKESAATAMRQNDKRKSYPLIRSEQKTHTHKTAPLPSCPSLSDIERSVDSKRQHPNYAKNFHGKGNASTKPSVKELTFGWNEPKIAEMLNYDSNNATRTEFKSKSPNAEPQAATIGWQLPPHKIDLDTVDGEVRHNLASNIETKNTPVKTRLFSGSKKFSGDSQKFIWSERMRNMSPWTNNKSASGGSSRPLKSNLKSSSRSFLNNSKKKILRLVSPKKDNKEKRSQFDDPRKTPRPQRTIGIQTVACIDDGSYELSLTPQSPPGSYHSAVQTSQQSSTTPTQTHETANVGGDMHFDFTRKVQSPPKKAVRTGGIQRKLNFPCVAEVCSNGVEDDQQRYALSSAPMTKTYRSFHSDLDQDVTLSKMGYILSNIRAKLEASDEHAVKTFEEIERREQQSASFDCPDSHNIRQRTRSDIHRNVERRHAIIEHDDPIYSEIEEDSICITASPQFDNTTGIQHFPAEHNPEALYAKVKKTPKKNLGPPPTALGKFLHDSLKNLNQTPLPPLPEPPGSYVSYSSPPPPTESPSVSSFTPNSQLSHCQSMNNIRVMEQHSPPKKNRNLSKSDLSLHRSEIFLDNLCRSEIIVNSSERLEKVDNHTLNQSFISLRNEIVANDSTTMSSPIPDDSVSYEMPVDDIDGDFNTAGSQLGLSHIEPPHSLNQSTPKKKPAQTQTFTTKQFRDDQMPPQLSVDVCDESAGHHTPHLLHNQSSSCPTTPRQLPPIPDLNEQRKKHAGSLNEVSKSNNNNSTNPLSISTLARYKHLKNALRSSLRKSKNFIKTETKKRLSTSLNYFPSSHSHAVQSSSSHSQSEAKACSIGSSFNLDKLFEVDSEMPVSQQLARAVSICRQLPDLEISPEMVEAERLLLFSTLQRETMKQKDFSRSLVKTRSLEHRQQQECPQRFFIDSMRLPVRENPSQDMFFNYFYIGTFECGGVIRSTQSVECCNHEAIFRDCGIEFTADGRGKEEGNHEEVVEDLAKLETAVRCEIFMLRLRKVSTLSLEPRKSIVKLPSPTSSASSSWSSTGGEEIVSRFRLHACFTLKARDFMPFEYVERESKNAEKICLRASGACSIPLTLRSKSTNLSREILLTGRAEVRFPKRTHSGFLNVQDPHSQHNWNRRWCTLNGLEVFVWQDMNDMKDKPLFSLDLRNTNLAEPLAASSREICARPRSFCLQCKISKADITDDEAVEVSTIAAVFFAAETQTDLSAWLLHLNSVLDFISNWMQ